ncbi:MAG: hypothetical protein ACRD35_04070 [Candidatus Acidiferrales bacterium]
MAYEEEIQLLNLSTGQVIGSLNQAQFELLKKSLVQKSPYDTNFFVNPEALEILREQGAGEVADLLATALGGAEKLEIGYVPTHATRQGRVRGRLLDLASQSPLSGYKVEAYDQDILADDFLGWGYADAEGSFEIGFDESAFKPTGQLTIEGKPEVKLRILNREGDEVGVVGIMRAAKAEFGTLYVSPAGKIIAPAFDPSATAICPSCGATYRRGFNTCADCEVPLHLLG